MKKVLMMILAAAVLVAPVAEATKLTFDSASGFRDEYGDRVAAAVEGNFSYGSDQGWTPNVSVEWQDDDESWFQIIQNGYGDFHNALVMDSEDWDNTSGYTICLRADPGYLVALHSFSISSDGPAYTVGGVTVRGAGGNILLGDTNFSQDNNIRVFGGQFPVVSREIKITLDYDGSNSGFSWLGLDNLIFSQIKRRGSQLGQVKTGATEESSWSDVKGLFR